MVPAVIMWGNDPVSQEQVETHKNRCKTLCPAALTHPVIVNQLCGAASQHPSAFPHYHLTNLGCKLQLFRELLLIWPGHTCMCRASAELHCLTGGYSVCVKQNFR